MMKTVFADNKFTVSQGQDDSKFSFILDGDSLVCNPKKTSFVEISLGDVIDVILVVKLRISWKEFSGGFSVCDS